MNLYLKRIDYIYIGNSLAVSNYDDTKDFLLKIKRKARQRCFAFFFVLVPLIKGFARYIE